MSRSSQEAAASFSLSIGRAGNEGRNGFQEIQESGFSRPPPYVRLRAPIQPPPQMRDCLCFELHLKQATAALQKIAAKQGPDPDKALAEIEQRDLPDAPPTFYKQPIYYKANRFAVIGTDEDVVWPPYSKFLDFELEFRVYIKGKVRDAPKADAMKHVFGYTIFNDMSARDAQAVEMGGGSAPRKVRISTRAIPWGRVWSRRTRFPIHIISP